MSLTGTAPRKPQRQPHPRARLNETLDQLDSEWQTLKQDRMELHGEDEAGLLAYYHVCTRTALHWIDGDPYSWQPPAEYARQRLAGLCRWLTGLQSKEGDEIKVERERMVTALRAAWPAYRDLGTGEIPNGTSPLDLEVLPFTWEGIETLWQGQNWEGDKPATFLPQFQSRASEDFHLAALALLILNKQLKYYLTDLKTHPTGLE